MGKRPVQAEVGWGGPSRDAARRAVVWIGIFLVPIPLAILAARPGDATGLVAAMGVVGGLAVAIAFVAKPIQALALFFASWAPLVFVLMQIEVGQFRVTRMIGALIVVGLSARILVRIGSQRRTLRLPVPLVWYAAFVAYAAVTLLWSPVRSQGINDLVRIATGLLVMVVCWFEIESDTEVNALGGGVANGALWASLGTVALFAFGPSEMLVVSSGATRAVGTLAGPNQTGFMAVFGIAVLFALSLKLPIIRRPLVWISAGAILFAAIAVTFSRTAILALVIFGVLYALIAPNEFLSRRRKLLVAGLLIGSLAVALVLRGEATIAHRVRDLPVLGAALSEKSGSSRIMLWKHQWSAFRSADPARMIGGLGLGATEHVKLSMPGLHGAEDAHGVHNGYLWLLIENGIIGSLIYFVFLGTVFKGLIRFVDARSEAQLPNRNFVAASVALLGSYQLSLEMFGWSINSIGVRIYVLALLGLALVVVGKSRAWRLGD